jgi:ATP-dependent Lon protease
VILPVDNKRDWEELDDKTRENTTVHFASAYEDVYKIAFSKAESRASKSKRRGAEAAAE